jgi:hypothetical protein
MKRAVVAGCIVAAAGLVGVAVAAEKKPAKHEISKIMKEGHKGDNALVQKVLKGTANDADKKLLLEYYQAMADWTPSKGSAQSWKTKTTALVKAAEGVVAGDKQSTAALKSAVNCKSCHTAHKPD